MSVCRAYSLGKTKEARVGRGRIATDWQGQRNTLVVIFDDD